MDSRLQDVQVPLNKIFSQDLINYVVPSKSQDKGWDFQMGSILCRPFGIAWLQGWVRAERPGNLEGTWWRLSLRDSRGMATFSATRETLPEIESIEGDEWRTYAGILIQAGTSLDSNFETIELPFFECIRLSPMEPRPEREAEWNSEVLLYKKRMLRDADDWNS